MTNVPGNLLAARSVLLTRLGSQADPVNGVDLLDPLDPVELGIVGDPAHRGGYHCGSDRVVDGDYSVVESDRDRAGLTLDAAALDVGRFRVQTPRGLFDLPHYSRWIVDQCRAGAPDTQHIREIIYSPDGAVVRRWDRLGRRSTGDSSHLFHTHHSYFRDAIKAGRDVAAAQRRYLTHIGLGDPMALFTDTHAATLDALARVMPALVAQVAYTDGRLEALATGRETVRADLKGGGSPVWAVTALKALAGLDGTQLADAIVADLLATLTPAAIAAAIPGELADQVADRLAARLQD